MVLKTLLGHKAAAEILALAFGAAVRLVHAIPALIKAVTNMVFTDALPITAVKLEQRITPCIIGHWEEYNKVSNVNQKVCALFTYNRSNPEYEKGGRDTVYF